MSAVSIRRRAAVFAASLGTLATFACSSGDSPSAPAGQVPAPSAPVAASIEVTTNGDSILLGTTRAFGARVLDKAGNVVSLPVTWRSLTPALLDIDANGVVTAIAPGAASVLASSGSVSDTGFVVVRAQDAPLAINPDLIQIVEGDELQLQARVAKSLGAEAGAQDVEWMSTDRDIATIDSVGRLVALNEGDVTLVARYGEYSAVANAVVVSATVGSITLNPTAATIPLGNKETIKAVVKDAAGNILKRTLTWTSSNPAVATVASTGQVSTLKTGYTVITASTGGKSSSATITVRSLPAKTVTVTLPSATQGVGTSQVAKVTALDINGQPVVGGQVAWQSNNPSVATVDSSGKVVARVAGKARISAIIDAVVGYADLTVVSPVATSIRVKPDSASVSEGATAQLTATVLDQAGLPLATQPAITWSSVQPANATVTSAGVVTGVLAGTATIKATSGALSDVAIVTVTKVPVASVSVTPAPATLAADDTLALAAQAFDAAGKPLAGSTFTFTSSDASVASVTSTGNVVGLKAGKAGITVSSGGKSKVDSVTVTPLVVATTTVTLGQPSLNVGQSTTASALAFSAKGAAITGRAVTWRSSNAAIATVTASGVVTAVSAGSAAIIATVDGVDGLATLVVAQAAVLPVAKITLTANSTTIKVGQGTQVVATLYDSLGNVLTGRTITWASSRVEIAKTSASGFTTGVSEGVVGISATSGKITSTIQITVSSTSTVSGPKAVTVSLSNNSLSVGSTATATATVVDSSGNVLSGLIVTWNSSNSAVASVTGTGLVTAVSGGSATISASVSGISGSAPLTVTASTVAVASVTVTLNTSTLTVGQLAQATAVARDAAGNVVTGQPVAWSMASGSSYASVNSTGLVSAVAAGSAQVKASVGSVFGVAPLTINPAPTTPAPGGTTTVPLMVTRLVAGTGSVLVSNAVPLKPGMLFANGLSNVLLRINNAEVPIAVAATAGTHKDGSLRSVVVQFLYDVPATGVAGTLHLGAARSLSMSAQPIPGAPVAVALPTDPYYLIATEIVGPTITVADSKAWSGVWTKYENDFVTYADKHWALYGADWASTNYYDRAQIYYAFWVRTGNPEYWRRGTLTAIDYRTKYLEPNNYNVSHHWSQLEGLADHYRLTGDAMSQKAVGMTADVLASYYRKGVLADTNHIDMESRIQARSLQSMLLAWEVQAPGGPNYTSSSWATHLPLMLTQILRAQNSQGAYIWGGYCRTSINYMDGLLNDAMIRYYQRFQADARIPSSIKANADWLWANQWRPTGASFNYQSAYCARNNSGPSASIDLNGLYATTYSWLYKTTGNTVYRTYADSIFAGGVKGAYLLGDKQFNQEYTSSYKYLFYRQ
ncbi:MAG: Ig-like domain-containing protein [Gemmatimonadaceae bacterium]